VLDNLSNFPVHFGFAFLALAAGFARARRRAWVAASLAAAAVVLAPVAPWYFGQDAAAAEPGRPWIKLFVSNVYYRNDEKRRLLQRVAEESPDVVGLVEVNANWLKRLKPVRERYPYHFEVPDEHYVGLALYSRIPLEDARVVELPGEASTPAIAATLKAPGGDVQIVITHPMSPVAAEYIRRRNAQVRALAEYARETGGPLVMAGDFNLTMWNAGYRPLAEVARLHNARQGYGVGPSWPSIWKLGVPIDQILGTEDIEFRDFRVLGGVGSDHLPLSAEFRAR
jgi:endonuclease/exonuclease/phosphatase (EEP) superfamily protein YafD